MRATTFTFGLLDALGMVERPGTVPAVEVEAKKALGASLGLSWGDPLGQAIALRLDHEDLPYAHRILEGARHD